MAAAYRVAAPSIRIVPWAALASCWPLPQQLLPVSATGGGRRRCTLAIISGKIIFNRTMPERLRTLRHCIFTGRGRKGKRQLPRLLPAEAAARRESFLLAGPLPSSPAALPPAPHSVATRQLPPERGEVFPQRESQEYCRKRILFSPETLTIRLTACALSVTCGDSSPKGRAKSTAGNFLITLKTSATNLTAWLPLWGSWRGSA